MVVVACGGHREARCKKMNIRVRDRNATNHFTDLRISRVTHPCAVCVASLCGFMSDALSCSSSWIFSIDNEWIFVVIIKPGPDFGKRILRPQLSPDDPLKDPGFWILDSVTFLVLQAPALRFWILDFQAENLD